MSKHIPFVLLLSATAALVQPAAAQSKNENTTTRINAGFAEVIAGMQHMPGFFPMYWDAKKGRMLLEVDKWETEFLYYAAVASGVGSNDIGLDRGRIGPSHVVQFERSGNKVLLVESNYDYRARSTDAQERRAVAESFARSVLWGFEVLTEEAGKVLVDATPFFLQQDAVGAAQDIARARQGNYRIDAGRSAFYLPLTKNFPQNTEVEVTTTLVGDNAGAYLRQVTPTPGFVSFRQHFSFVELPDKNYTPRLFDPRAGVGYISFFDYATPVDQPIERRYMRRHRLEKKDPAAALSEAVNPIVYYIDPGTPEPIRTALMEGTAWWNKAFEAAGFKDAFQVKLLPPDADPMDVRYNLVQWVHRSTRGWSYGGGITDPRTGEIIKGKVTLGSLRVRQDYLIAQGLLADFEAGKPLPPQAMQLCMARMRQLAAHEVGHTLGLPHNYIASSQARASVMDYPHPYVQLDASGNIDLSNAYAEGIGAWDKAAITMAYKPFAAGADEAQALETLVQQYRKQGLTFLSDQDARPAGSAHPAAHLWDNGANAVDELHRILKVRSTVLHGFSERKIPVGAPMATLEEVLVPMYLLHRYQVEAAAKLVGGVHYTYALRGDGQVPLAVVPAKEQMRALDACIETLKPAVLALPQRLLSLIPPRPFGYDKNERETFQGYTGLTFDPVAPAETAAAFTLGFLFHPERAARLEQQHALDPQQLSFTALAQRVLNATLWAPKEKAYPGQVQQAISYQVVLHLAKLAANHTAAPMVRAAALQLLADVQERLKKEVGQGSGQRGFYLLLQSHLSGGKPMPESLSLPGALPIPDGAPIGSADGCGEE